MVYEGLLLIGGVGLLAQAALGFAHGGGAQGGHEFHGGDVHGHLHVHLHVGDHHGAAGGSSGGHAQAEHAHAEVGGKGASGLLWALFSPLTLFSVCLGAGVSGLAAQAATRNPILTAVLAALGGILFYGLFVRPVWRLIFAFASKPAENLDGTLAREAEAVSCFDKHGRGVVRVTVDGELVRLLARLDTDDLSKASQIVPGETLVVTGIDGKRNTCTVARM